MRFNRIYLLRRLLNGSQNEIEKFLIALCDRRRRLSTSLNEAHKSNAQTDTHTYSFAHSLTNIRFASSLSFGIVCIQTTNSISAVAWHVVHQQ